MTRAALEDLVRRLPKAELHLHIEGTLEPEMAFDLAERNGVSLRFSTAAALREAYRFHDLQSFLDIYYECASVLITRRDFRDLTWAYLERAASNNVRHAELFFDPQTHTERGVSFETVVDGITDALVDAQSKLGMSTGLVMCFLRHLSGEAALETWHMAQPFRDRLLGVGLDSGEVDNPPEKFQQVFALARAQGLHLVAHAGEEGPPQYIRQALDLLRVERIDHGVRCAEDPALVERLVREQVPLTVCPLSNVRLAVFDDLRSHNLKQLLERGLCVSLHSDDPAYFGGYINDNYTESAVALGLSPAQLVTLADNSVRAAFLPEDAKRGLRAEIAAFG